MADMQAERDELFGFTDDEVGAWGSKDHGSSSLNSSELDKINEMLGQPDHDPIHQTSSPPQHMSSSPHHPPPPPSHPHGFTHLTPKSATSSTFSMVDVSRKSATTRTATALSSVHLAPSVASAFSQSSATSPATAKGPVFDIARLAGIMGTKHTSTLIPLCHPLALSHAEVELSFPTIDNAVDYSRIDISCSVKCDGKTGVEMEAMTGAVVASLTVYDMVKAISHECTIGDVKIVEKSGGKRQVEDGKNIN